MIHTFLQVVLWAVAVIATDPDPARAQASSDSAGGLSVVARSASYSVCDSLALLFKGMPVVLESNAREWVCGRFGDASRLSLRYPRRGVHGRSLITGWFYERGWVSVDSCYGVLAALEQRGFRKGDTICEVTTSLTGSVVTCVTPDSTGPK